MTWLRLDDGFYDHGKLATLSPPAGWLWVRALGWSSKHLRDGYVPANVVRWLAGREHERLSRELEAAGLWTREGDGWRAHDFTDYNPSSQVVLARRKAAKDRMDRVRKGGSVRANNDERSREQPRVFARTPENCSQSFANCSPVPSRPVPSEGSPTGNPSEANEDARPPGPGESRATGAPSPRADPGPGPRPEPEADGRPDPEQKPRPRFVLEKGARP